MCGFLGTIHKKNYKYDEEEFIKNLNLIKYRGPDDQGIIFFDDSDHSIKLGHRRLSIIDLSNRGHQPMISDRKSVLIFNGEIYNHNIIRKTINDKVKVAWKSQSDTEVLLYFLENFDTEFVLNNIEGMFSFCFYNNLKKEIILARDLAGEKPLYIQTDSNFISFSSDIKSLSSFSGYEKKINHNSLKDYLKYSYIPNPNSIFENIFKLPPGSYLTINTNNFVSKKIFNFNDFILSKGITYKEWWKIEDEINKKNNNDLTESQILSETEYLLDQSVKKQLISDAPLGAFLSGGIDSSLIVALASKYKSDINTFTIGYDFNDYDESKYAKKIANHLKTKHNSYICTKKDTLDVIPNLFEAYSEPFADSSQIPTMLISKIARQKVTVALSGDGGDELFGGYNRYLFANKYWKYLNILPVKFRNFIINVFMNIPKKYQENFLEFFFFKKISGSSSKSTKFLEKIKRIESKYSFYDSLVTNWENNSEILNDFNFTKDNNYALFFNKYSERKLEDLMMMSDFKSYMTDGILCKVDRASMYNSLETRAPFLDKSLVNYSMKLSTTVKIKNGNSKWLLKTILSKYLPSEFFERPKMGFGIPLSYWLKNDLKDYMMDTLSNDILLKHGLFNHKVVEKTIKDHLDENYNNENKIWNLIQFNNWYINNFSL